jgi:hypothetical protein
MKKVCMTVYVVKRTADATRRKMVGDVETRLIMSRSAIVLLPGLGV